MIILRLGMSLEDAFYCNNLILEETYSTGQWTIDNNRDNKFHSFILCQFQIPFHPSKSIFTWAEDTGLYRNISPSRYIISSSSSASSSSLIASSIFCNSFYETMNVPIFRRTIYVRVSNISIDFSPLIYDFLSLISALRHKIILLFSQRYLLYSLRTWHSVLRICLSSVDLRR
jgi:hypothetical protein